MESGVVENPLLSVLVNNNTNTTLNGTASNLLFQQQEPLAERIAKKYPVESNIIAIFDFVGLIVFFSGFLYFLKGFFVYSCGKICVGRKKNNKDDGDKALKSSQIQLVTI